MRKRIGILMVVVLLCAIAAPAVAEGKLKATSVNLVSEEGQQSGIFFAKVENVGDAAVCFGKGMLVAFSTDDEILFTRDYIASPMREGLLAPGDYVYLKEYFWEESLAGATVGEVKLSVTTGEQGAPMVRVPCESTFTIDRPEANNSWIEVTFTNDTDAMVDNFVISVALMDAADNLVYVDSYTNSNIAVHTGSTITVKLSMDYNLLVFMQEQQIQPVKIDAMVCCVQ